MTESVRPAVESSVIIDEASAMSVTLSPNDRPEKVCLDGGGLITRSETGWLMQVGFERIELPADTGPKHAAERFADLCGTVKGAHKRCVLALDASECFFADIELPDSIDANDRGAVTFELERHIPLDAEAMVSDHWSNPTSGRIAAVAVQSDRQREVIDALEAVGVEVVSIIPMAFLATRSAYRLFAQQSKLESAAFGLMLFHGDSIDALTMEAGRVSQWRQFFDSDDELRRHQSVTSDKVDSSGPVFIVGREQLSFPIQNPVHRSDTTFYELAAEGANLALRGRWGRWPDLRRGNLAPKDPLFAVAGPLRILALAAVACLLVISAAAWFRGAKLADESQRIRQQQRAAFTTAYPDRRVPVMLMRTIRSEHNKALGSRGRGDTIKLPIPATTVLRQLYRGIEHAQRVGGARLRLIDITVVDGECSLTVRATEAVEIGVVAKSLETVGFQVAPPASEQIEPSKDEPIPTYQSTITAVWMDDQPSSTGANGT